MILDCYGYTRQETTLANEMNFVVNHAPGAGLIAQPVSQQSSVLPLYHGCLLGEGERERRTGAIEGWRERMKTNAKSERKGEGWEKEKRERARRRKTESESERV